MKLPQVDLSFIELYQLVIAPIKSRLMLTGIEVEVFDLLSEARSSEDVAEILGTHPENTRIFLDGLAAFDLLEKWGGLYENSMISETFLVGSSPTFVGNFLAEQWQYIEPVLDDLLGLVTKGSTEVKGGPERESEDETARWAKAVANYERSGIAQMVTGLIGELPEFPSFRKMLDLGGGPGLIGMAVVAAHPTMRGVISQETPSAILVSGPFRISRHPMYLGMAAILLGEAVFLGSLATFVFPLIFAILMEVLFISTEEENLEKAFGKDYLDYKTRVRRWI